MSTIDRLCPALTDRPGASRTSVPVPLARGTRSATQLPFDGAMSCGWPARFDLGPSPSHPEDEWRGGAAFAAHAPILRRHRAAEAVIGHDRGPGRRANQARRRGRDVHVVERPGALDGQVNRVWIVGDLLLERVVEIERVEGTAVEAGDVCADDARSLGAEAT